MTETVEILVRRFYEEAWNRWDDTVVDGLLAEDFVFRGSLGDETRGREGWRGYRDTIRRAVPDFHNEIVWATEATHPALPGVIVHGTAVIEWLEGQRFLIHRARTDHPEFPTRSPSSG